MVQRCNLGAIRDQGEMSDDLVCEMSDDTVSARQMHASVSHISLSGLISPCSLRAFTGGSRP